MEGYRGSMRLDGYLLKDIDVTPTRDGEIFPIFALFLLTYVTAFSNALLLHIFTRILYYIFKFSILLYIYILLKQSCLIRLNIYSKSNSLQQT